MKTKIGPRHAARRPAGWRTGSSRGSVWIECSAPLGGSVGAGYKPAIPKSPLGWVYCKRSRRSCAGGKITGSRFGRLGGEHGGHAPALHRGRLLDLAAIGQLLEDLVDDPLALLDVLQLAAAEQHVDQ